MAGKYQDIQPFATMNPSCPLGNMNWTSFNWLGAEPHKARNPFSKQGKPSTYGNLDVWCGDSAEEKYYGSPEYFGGKNVNQDYFAPYEYGQGPYTKDYYNTNNSYHSQTIQIVNPNGGLGVTPLPIIGFTATLFNPGFGSNFSSDCRWVKVWGHYTKASNGYTYSWEMSSNQYTLRNTFERTQLALDKSHEMGENEFRNVLFIVEDPVNRNKIGTEDYYMTGISISTWMGRQAGMQKYNGHSLFNLMPSIHENFWKATGHNLPGWINGLQRTDSTMIMPALHSIHTLGQNQWWAHNEITKFAEGSVWNLQIESMNQASGKYLQEKNYY